jgi:hypothetical protein
MKLAEAGLLAAALTLTLESPALAQAGPRPRAADAPPGGQRDETARLRVVLVRPADADPITAEALVRIQADLTAEGFSVVLVDAPANVPGRPAEGTPPDPSTGAGTPVDAEAAQGSAVAIRLSLDTSTHVAELVVTDRLRNKKFTRWIDTHDAPPDRAAEVLAVRAVELLRASLVELALPGAKTPAPCPSCPPPPKPPDPMWGLEAGVSVLVSPRGVGPAALALARLRFAPIRLLELRVAFAGPGTSPRVEGPDGASARVTQLLPLGEIALRPWPDLRVRPSFSLSGGAIGVSVEGEATPPSPYKGREATTWSALVGGGVGAEVLIGPHFGVAAEARAFAAIPYPSVRFLGQEAARIGVPAVLASLTLVGWP